MTLNEQNKIFIDEQTNVVFTPNQNGVYLPRLIQFDPISGQAKVMSKIPVMRELYEWVIYSRKELDKVTGKPKPVLPFTYQWGTVIEFIVALCNPNSQEFLDALSRQAGKSTTVQVLIPFCLTMLPKYVEVDKERFSAILGSYKDDAVKNLYKNVKPYILKAIEFYNKRNRDKLICKDLDASQKLISSDTLMEIDKIFSNGQQIPYSQIRNVSAGTTNDGYYAHILMIDEVGLIDTELYLTSMANFTSATNGISIYMGVPNKDASSLFYDRRKSRGVKTFLYDFPKVYMGKLLVNKKEAAKYKRNYEQKLLSTSGGIKSSFIQWNYYLNVNDVNGKFMSREALVNNNVLTEEIRLPQSSGNKFTVAGIDVSAVGDYKVMVVGETTQLEEFDFASRKKIKTYSSTVCDIVAFNKEGKKQSGEEFARLSAEMCQKYKLDCVCVDSSGAGGKFFTQMFRKYLKLLGIKVMILPFSYNQNKQFLFTALEDAIYSGKLHLLKEDESWESKQLIDEMTYMLKKHVPGSTYVKYEAPKGSGFTDDHVNALALFNVCVKEIYERSRDLKKCRVEDGSGESWRLKLRRYATVDVQPENDVKKNVVSIWTVPL